MQGPASNPEDLLLVLVVDTVASVVMMADETLNELKLVGAFNDHFSVGKLSKTSENRSLRVSLCVNAVLDCCSISYYASYSKILRDLR